MKDVFVFKSCILNFIIVLGCQVLNQAVEAGTYLPGPELMDAVQSLSGPIMLHHDLNITVIAAHVLTQLIMHGASFLSPFLPPSASELDGLRQSSPDSVAVSALEGAVSQFLILIPLMASAIKVINQEVQVETFIFHVSLQRQPCPLHKQAKSNLL
jgi:hypothetical protein